MDTILDVETMIDATKFNEVSIKKGVAYILNSRNEDGGFGYLSDEQSSVYLTAYSITVLEKYKNSMKVSSEELNIAIEDAKNCLLEAVESNSTWGVDENNIKSTLMATIALSDMDNETTIVRINEISEVLEENGSVYSSPTLTAMFVNAICSAEKTPDVDENNNPQIKDMYVYTNQADEMIGAYTDVCIEPILEKFDSETMTLTVIVGNRKNGFETAEDGADSFVWNTRNFKSGEYEIYAIIADKDSGKTLALRKKIIEIKDELKIDETYIDINPKYSRIDSAKEISVEVLADVRTNINKSITAKITVTDENHNKIFVGNDNVECSKDTNHIEFKPFKFQPEVTKAQKLKITVQFMDGENILETKEREIKIYDKAPEKRTELDYTISKESLSAGSDEVEVKFSLKGLGKKEENIDRQPVDIVIALDDSGSMSEKDWELARKSAEQVVQFLQPEDRCAVISISGITFCGLTSDTEEIIKGINKQETTGGWTLMHGAFMTATKILKESPEGTRRVMLMFSDGQPMSETQARRFAKEAVNENITISTLGLGDQVIEFLKELAVIGSGTFISSPTNEQLVDMMYKMLGNIFNPSGKNLKLKMTLEKDIPYEDIEIDTKPESVTKNDDGTTTIEWNKSTILVGKISDYAIKFKGKNLTEGDIVKLIKDISFEYTDEVEEVNKIELESIAIKVKSNKPDTSINTDKTNYSSNEDVNISLSMINNTVPNKNITGVVNIVDEDGNIIESLSEEITVNEALNETYTWNTKSYMAGKYKVNVKWYIDENCAGEKNCEFSIVSDAEFTNNVFTDEGTYKNNSIVKITDKITSAATNDLSTPIEDIITISDEKGNVVYSKNVEVKMFSQSAKTVEEQWDASDVEPGIYTIECIVKADGKTVSHANKSIEILAEKESIVLLKGNIEVQKKEVTIGEEVNLTYDCKNYGEDNLKDVDITVNVVNTDTKATEYIGTEKCDMDSNKEIEKTLDITGGELGSGNYLAVYSAKVGQVTIPINSVAFAVEEPKYELEIKAKSGGSIEIGEDGFYIFNGQVEIKAKADADFKFVRWVSSDGGTFENENQAGTIFNMPEGRTTITAEFELKKYAINISAGSGGRILSGASGEYARGENIKLEAEPFEGYAFKCWALSGSGKINNINNTQTTYETAQSDTDVVAIFEKISAKDSTTKYKVSIKEMKGGKIVKGKSGSYEGGKIINLEAKAKSGYEFAGWKVIGNGKIQNKSKRKTTFTVIDSDARITAIFKKNTVSEGGGKKKKTVKEPDIDQTTYVQGKGQPVKYAQNSNGSSNGASLMDIVRTGDKTPIFKLLLLLSISATLVVVIFMKKRKDTDKKEEVQGEE